MNNQFNRFDNVIIREPTNICATFSGWILEDKGNDTYLVGFVYQGVQTTTEVSSSQLTPFGDDTFVVVASSGGSQKC